ncbi:hypothetical protein SAMN04244567_04180, partial [Paracoccus pantotrophus]
RATPSRRSVPASLTGRLLRRPVAGFYAAVDNEAALDWHKRERFVPPNHYVIVPNALCDQRPDLVREVWRMLVKSRAAATPEGSIDPWPVGIEANRKALEAAIRFATQQHMITTPITVEELFHPLIRDIAP